MAKASSHRTRKHFSLLIPVVVFGLISHTQGSSSGEVVTGQTVEAVNDLAASATEDSALSSNSHKIIALGWPSTSPMWPSISAADDIKQESSNSSGWINMVEPFIFADKPRSVDYSLLLNINKTVQDILKNHLKPMAVNLSFEYYFNHDSKTTALPGIKIEVDRKQFKYLEPTSGGLIKTRMWMKFNEQIVISDQQQLDNHDWLKFSLVNRQSPSLVAIRKLKVEFVMDAPPVESSNKASSNQPTPAPVKPASTGGSSPTPRPADSSESEIDLTPAPSDTLSTALKPVEPKKSGWGWGGRKKRDLEGLDKVKTNSSAPANIVLTCYESQLCDWRPEVGEEIQWSLARMPPSTDIVRSGYFYVSNRSKYGDPTKMLTLHLQQTDSATIADQNSDHCIELALYVTEQSHLRLYRLVNASNPEPVWTKQNLLLTWAPTMAVGTSFEARSKLPGAHMRSMDPGNSGWTLETLCFGDFFSNPKECGSSKCAFGFEMVTDVARHQKQQHGEISYKSSEEPPVTPNLVEQVIGVAILREYSLNVPIKSNQNNWLEAWQRDEVKPSDNWSFYPKFDININNNNVSLTNLFDDAHFYIESAWLQLDEHLDFSATMVLELNSTVNQTNTNQTDILPTPESTQLSSETDGQLFQLRISTKLVDSRFDTIFTTNSTIDWSIKNNSSLSIYNLGLPVTESVKLARNGHLILDDKDDGRYRIVLEFVLDSHWLNWDPHLSQFLTNNNVTFNLSLANVSLSERCFPNPCQFGTCHQNGTNYEDWNCDCDDKHRGRHCEFGRWCNTAHVTPWTPAAISPKGSFVIKPPNISSSPRQAKAAIESVMRVTGKEFCSRKLGPGAKCSDMDIPLNENLYTEDEKTFTCSCQDDFYLSDESKCKQAHLCNSIVCPSVGMICDELKPFNSTQPCHCNEKQDWFPDVEDPLNKCMRKQCQDKSRDCGFDAHICLPSLLGEKPICKCGPKFSLKTNEKGQKYCQSTACVLPTLNDCGQICLPDNGNLNKPFTCACHPGYVLSSDGRSCSPSRPNGPHCKPACHSENQICTDVGCRCKQGYIGEGEIIVQQQVGPRGRQPASNSSAQIDYTRSIRCLNICSLSYAENKDEFEKVESVCPLGLCDPSDFQCRCSDPNSSALINTKYEPIYARNSTDGDDSERVRISPLCSLRRICEPDSSAYKICHNLGAICVPDYTKAAMFDCICPPTTEKKFYGQATSGEFTCEPKCSSKKYDCLRRQAICKLVDKDQVKCDCLPGLMFNEHDQKCYLAHYSYAFNLVVINRYYEPESKFHRLVVSNSTDLSITMDQDEISKKKANEGSKSNLDPEHPDLVDFNDSPNQFNRQMVNARLTFIAELNQCNVSQVLPKSVIEDPYEHDIESFLGYIDQCNEKLHQNTRTYQLNSKLAEDLRQSLRQHLRDFTVTTSNSSCVEIDTSGMYLNCTVYLQSNEPVSRDLVEYVFSNCDKNGQDSKYCWIKPRLLLRQPQEATDLRARSQAMSREINFRQIVACEIDNFCGQDAFSIRTDEKTSLCSCKCPRDIEVIDVKDLQPRLTDDDPSKIAVKEVCAPRNHCGANSTFCLIKSGSTCHYDVRLGSRCLCIYPSYEDNEGRCVEVTYSRLDNTLIVIIILLGTGLIVSIAINLTALIKSRNVFGRSKQYPLNEFPRTINRSTGIPNPGFTND